MSLDENGFVTKRYSELVDQLNTQLKATVGPEVDTTENSLIGHMHSNFALALSQLWELGQDVYNSGDLFNAEGAGLENLAGTVGLTRNPETRTSGIAYFVGEDGTNIEQGSRVISVRGDEFDTESTFTITSLNCVTTRVHVAIVQSSTDYILVIDDVSYTFTSDANATTEEILAGLESVLQIDGSVTVTVVLDSVNDTDSYLLIDRVDKTSTMSVSGTTYLVFDNVVTPSTINSIEYGSVPGDALAVNGITSGVTGWYSVYNPSDLTLGDTTESDTELRTRIVNGYSTVGSATIDSIGSKVKAVDGVAAVYIRENDTTTTDANGVPPKSYEVIVHEGLNQEIAEVIWATKPAGIYTHGTTLYTVTDFNGFDQSVRFTRPDEKYVFIDVRYTPYTEEVLPSGAEDNAKLAMLTFADDNLSINDDIIAKRFLGSIYSASTGFGDITISVAYTDNPLIPPTYPDDYEDTLEITDAEISSFATDRMFFTQV